MPLYYFHIIDGEFLVDQDGTECINMDDVRTQAIATAGALLRDKAGTYQDGERWQMHVTNAAKKTVFKLQFSAETIAI
jgi:hypothetical protein